MNPSPQMSAHTHSIPVDTLINTWPLTSARKCALLTRLQRKIWGINRSSVKCQHSLRIRKPTHPYRSLFPHVFPLIVAYLARDQSAKSVKFYRGIDQQPAATVGLQLRARAVVSVRFGAENGGSVPTHAPLISDTIRTMASAAHEPRKLPHTQSPDPAWLYQQAELSIVRLDARGQSLQ